MLRTRLFQAFALLIVLFGVVAGWYGVGVIRRRVREEAQGRVRLDLTSAWSLYRAREREVEIVLQMAASRPAVVAACRDGRWPEEDVAARLEVSRKIPTIPELRDTPVLLVTGIRREKSLAFSFEPDATWLPVERVLEKPVPPEKLLGEITRIFAD